MSGRPEAGTQRLAPVPPARFVLPRAHRGVLSSEDRTRTLAVARELLSTPTAPYFEDGVLAVVRRLAGAIPGVRMRADAHGNLIVLGSARARRGRRTLVFSAHLDHPGFHVLPGRGATPRVELHGGVPARFLPGAALRFHDARTGRALATARIRSAAEREDRSVAAELAGVRGAVRPGSFGVFDLTDGFVRGTRLQSRVCDDLLGAVAILVTLDRLARAGHAHPVAGVFTRAEETGFVGCIGLLEARALPPDSAVIGLECSPRRAAARVGHGPVLRVGDRQSVFDPELSHLLQTAAGALKSDCPGFLVQRALMDGGSCESTAYNAWGVPAGGACLALGNYHNCGPGERIAAEFVDWNDLEGLVALLTRAASEFAREGTRTGIRDRLLRNYARESRRLAASSRRLRAGGVRSRGEVRT